MIEIQFAAIICVDYLCNSNQSTHHLDTDPLPSDPVLSALVLLSSAIEFHAPESWGSWFFIVAIALCCLLASAFISGSEIAYFGLTHSDIDDLHESDDEHSKKAYYLITHSERLLATILICNNLVNITMVVLLTFAINAAVYFHSDAMSFLVQTVFLTFLLLLFGEIFPKLVAKGRTVAWARAASPALSALYRFFSPMSRLMVKSTSVVNHIVTKKPESISTDELASALEISDLKEGKDKEMLEGILSFGEKEVCDIMISRVDVTAIEYHNSWKEVMDVMITSGYSRVPVYDTTQDQICGVLYSKDMLPYVSKEDEHFPWQELIREAYFVPESRMIDDLLEDFRRKKIHMAIVVDEYGGTRGIVTLEDVIEEIVGAIDDEYDQEEKLYKRIGQDTYIFEAKIPVSDFCRVTGVDEEELKDYDDAETLAGLLLAIKGDFPKEKEALELGRLRFLVLDIEKHRITEVRVKVLPAESGDN